LTAAGLMRLAHASRAVCWAHRLGARTHR